MSQQAVMRVDGDTSGLSAALGNVSKQARGVGTALASSVPILGQMTSSTGVLLTAVVGVGSVIREWSQGIDRGNQELDKTLRKARELAGGAGQVGMVSSFRQQAVGISTEGPLAATDILGAMGTFRDFAPGATGGQTAAAGRVAQRTAIAGVSQDAVMRVVGVIVNAVPGISVTEAADIAIALIQGTGAAATRVPQELEQLLGAGFSLEDAAGMILSMTTQGAVTARVRSGIVSAAVQAGERTRGATQALSATARMQGMEFQSLDRQAVAGSLQRQVDMALDDDDVARQVSIEVSRNRQAAMEEQRADLELEAVRAQMAADDAGRSAFGRVGAAATRGARARFFRSVGDEGGVGSLRVQQSAGLSMPDMADLDELVRAIAELTTNQQRLNADGE